VQRVIAGYNSVIPGADRVGGRLCTLRITASYTSLLDADVECAADCGPVRKDMRSTCLTSESSRADNCITSAILECYVAELLSL
jgi:hypothetical protein